MARVKPRTEKRRRLELALTDRMDLELGPPSRRDDGLTRPERLVRLEALWRVHGADLMEGSDAEPPWAHGVFGAP
jgi:hypothetical protein